MQRGRKQQKVAAEFPLFQSLEVGIPLVDS